MALFGIIVEEYIMLKPQDLYNALMERCKESAESNRDEFYYVDHRIDETKFMRIFCYRMVGRTGAWTKPGSLFARGTVFLLKNNRPDLVSLCMPKFFNLAENEISIQPEELFEPYSVQRVEQKADGSLITLFICAEAPDEWKLPGTNIVVKSKTSFTSDVCKQVHRFFERETDMVKELEEFMESLQIPMSHNFEWCSPDNRIVVPYSESRLVYLNSVVHPTGRVISAEGMNQFPRVKQHPPVATPNMLAGIKQQADHEGIVIWLYDGRACKIKTEWYMRLHHARDNFQSTKHLARCVFSGSMDDLKSWFQTDRHRLEKIEHDTMNLYSNVMARIDYIIAAVQDLETRKEIAIKAKEMADATQGFEKMIHAFVMATFTGKSTERIKDGIKETVCTEVHDLHEMEAADHAQTS